MSIESYAGRLNSCLMSMNASLLERVVLAINTAMENGHNIYIIGNGGSAATSSHFATDLNKIQYQRKLKGSAVCLSDNSSMLTMITNDYDFKKVYSFQLQIGAKSGDLLVAISASGNSSNLVDAVEYCNLVGMKTISFTGFDGGLLSQISKISLHAETRVGDYGIAEDAHSVICHYIAEAIRNV